MAEVLAEVDSGDESKGYSALWFRISALLAGFVALNWVITNIASLEPSRYREAILLVELAKSIGSPFTFIGPVGPLALAAGLVGSLWFLRKQLLAGWTEVAPYTWVRVVIVTIAFVLAWRFSTFDTNLFYGQLHLVDRLALVALVPLIWWRPVFVGPFVIQQMVIMTQLSSPLPGFSTAEPKTLAQILMVFVAYFLIRRFTGHLRVHDFAFLTFVVVASSFWVAGFGKIRLGWLTHGHMERLLVSTYANGWLGFLDVDTVVDIASAVASVDWLLRILTLVAELGAIIALRRRSTLMVWLTLWIGLHIGVLALTGIFFWKWLIVEVALLIVLWRRGDHLPIFTRPHFILAAALIFMSSIWLEPPQLSWLNTRITYTYRIEATGQSGEQYSLPPAFFAPYDYQFTIGLFPYLSEHPLLPLAWGAADERAVADAFVPLDDLEQLAIVEAELGHDFFDPDAARVFDGFIHDFVDEFNQRGSKTDWPSRFGPIRQLITLERDDAFGGDEPIVSVRVVLVTTQFTDDAYAELRAEVLRQINITPVESTSS